MDELYRILRFVVEVADAVALRATTERVHSFANVLERATREGQWETGSDLGVRPALKLYLHCVDYTVPDLDEAARGIGAVTDFLSHHGLQTGQSQGSQGSRLLERSLSASLLSAENPRAAASSCQKTMRQTVTLAGKLGLPEPSLRATLLDAAKGLPDQTLLQLLLGMKAGARDLDLELWSMTRGLVLSWLNRETIRQRLVRDPAAAGQPHVSWLLLAYFFPRAPEGIFTSRTFSGDPREAIRHDEAFDACRLLLDELLNCPGETPCQALSVLAEIDGTSLDDLVRWLGGVREFVEGSEPIGEALGNACRATLDALLSSESQSMMYHGGPGPHRTISWREASTLPPLIEELLLPYVHAYAVHVVGALHERPELCNKRHDIVNAVVPALVRSGELPAVCADLATRVSGFSGGSEERVIIPAFLERALMTDGAREQVVTAVGEALRRETQADSWTGDRDLATLLLGQPGEIGRGFAELFLAQVPPATIPQNQGLWARIDWLVAGTEDATTFLARVGDILALAQVLAEDRLTRQQGLGAWATLISAAGAKAGRYRFRPLPLPDLAIVLEVLDLRGFGKAVARLREEEAGRQGIAKAAVESAISDWENVAVLLLERRPEWEHLDNQLFSALIRLRQRQSEFGKVRGLVDKMVETGLARDHPGAVVSALGACLEGQDLDGLERLFRGGLCDAIRSDPRAGADFLATCLGLFWRRGEVRLSQRLLKDALGLLHDSPGEVAQDMLHAVVEEANDRLRREFREPLPVSILEAAP